jgi:5'-nucleotidase
MPTILVTNDDGVHDPGLLVLKQELEDLGDVMVLAPERNRSAISHAITMHKPLRIQSVTLADGSAAHTCSGTPADCVRLAAGGVLGTRPDLVVSGINAGHNLGSDVYYSGTVACAREAAINGIPGIAVSTVFPHLAPASIEEIWRMAAAAVRTLVISVRREGLPEHTLLNVNVPGVHPEELKGQRITRIGSRSYRLRPEQREDPFGRAYYWPAGTGPHDEEDETSDVGAVGRGYISVTPIRLDATHYGWIEQFEARHGL